jgi:hypothetical protein
VDKPTLKHTVQLCGYTAEGKTYENGQGRSIKSECRHVMVRDYCNIPIKPRPERRPELSLQPKKPPTSKKKGNMRENSRYLSGPEEFHDYSDEDGLHLRKGTSTRPRSNRFNRQDVMVYDEYAPQMQRSPRDASPWGVFHQNSLQEQPSLSLLSVEDNLSIEEQSSANTLLSMLNNKFENDSQPSNDGISNDNNKLAVGQESINVWASDESKQPSFLGPQASQIPILSASNSVGDYGLSTTNHNNFIPGQLSAGGSYYYKMSNDNPVKSRLHRQTSADWGDNDEPTKPPGVHRQSSADWDLCQVNTKPPVISDISDEKGLKAALLSGRIH